MQNQATKKSEVMELQNMLRLISQTGGTIPLVNPDGIFGAETEAAVIAFQKEVGLPPNGMVDFATWTAIFDAYMNASRMISLQPIQPFPAGDYKIRRGERSDIVLIIQLMLSALAISLEIFDEIERSGIYDEKTEAAVVEFQKLHLLPPNGIIDYKTWNTLAKSYGHIADNPLYTS